MLLIPILLGAWMGYGALAAPHGYAAAYSVAGAWITAVLTGIASLLLLAVRSARKAGILGLVAAGILLGTFYLVFLTGYGLGLHAWRHKQQIEIPSTTNR
jgi:hypothetical protein